MNHDLSSKQLEIKNNLEKDAVKSAMWISGFVGIFVFIILYFVFPGFSNYSTIKLIINAALGAFSGYLAYSTPMQVVEIPLRGKGGVARSAWVVRPWRFHNLDRSAI